MSGPNTSSAVMAQRHEPHDSLDYFPTPPWATRALCEILSASGEDLGAQTCWEPACGDGFMARPLREYFKSVQASDVHDYGGGQDRVEDFLWPAIGAPAPAADWIVTNPPFKLGLQFVLTALARAGRGVAIFTRAGFLESEVRHRRLYKPFPPRAIYQFFERVSLVKGCVDPAASRPTAYVWIIWRIGRQDGTAFHWIEACKKRLVRDSDHLARGLV